MVLALLGKFAGLQGSNFLNKKLRTIKKNPLALPVSSRSKTEQRA